MPLSVKQTGPASCIITDANEEVCDIRDLRLCNARFRPGGRRLIGSEVPLPLFWEQYANHEDPERNAGSDARLVILQSGPAEVEIRCTGSTRSGSVSSSALLRVTRKSSPVRYEYEIRTEMVVNEGMEWVVTPNPQQGELEFCNLWAEGVFNPDLSVPLRYQSTYVRRGEQTIRIPHHHLETRDKENIPLSIGDQVAWLLEDENLCCTILHPDPVTAAVCAYMWDLHLAHRVCLDDKARRLGPGTISKAHFRLTSLSREEGLVFMKGASDRGTEGGATGIPVFRNGITLLKPTGPADGTDDSSLWPWEREVIQGDPEKIRFSVEPTDGPGECPALLITSAGPARAAWRVSGLGPAYRQPPFPENARYKFSSLARIVLPGGSAALSLRLHRSSSPGLFDTSSYEIFTTPVNAAGDRWTRVECVTPVISPPPDRLHLLCEHHGEGSSAFADVRFEILT